MQFLNYSRRVRYANKADFFRKQCVHESPERGEASGEVHFMGVPFQLGLEG